MYPHPNVQNDPREMRVVGELEEEEPAEVCVVGLCVCVCVCVKYSVVSNSL